MACTCGQIFIGSEATGQRNWSPDCLEHGTESEWWNSAGQIEKRNQQNKRLRDLQRQAREARKNAQVD